MSDQREAVRDNARYLRNVRPIDPEEVSEYVEGQPHPAVVRQYLRELAVDLDLVERADGTFVPVESGRLSVAFDGVPSLPAAHATRLADLLVETYGAGWSEGDSGDRLRRVVRRLKADYYRGNDVEYTRETALGYAVYHLPDNYAAVQYVLADLAAAERLPRRLRVLDVGAGVGGPALGVHDLLYGRPGDEAPTDAPTPPLVAYDAVEPSAAADVFEALLDDADRNFHWSLHRETAESFAPEGPYDVILFANVLSELDDPIAVADRYFDALAPDGSFVALAPADRNTAIGLRRVERALENDAGATVYGPTVRLWPDAVPANRGWSFDVEPDLDVPDFQRQLDESCRDPEHDPGEFVNVDVQYAYSVLRRDGARAIEVAPDASRVARMDEMDRHVTGRIDLLAVKLSHDLSTDGHPLYLVGDGSQREDHYAVLVDESTLNAALSRAGYGDLLRFENVLVLWNADEGAYNLVVDDEVVVDRVPT